MCLRAHWAQYTIQVKHLNIRVAQETNLKIRVWKTRVTRVCLSFQGYP